MAQNPLPKVTLTDSNKDVEEPVENKTYELFCYTNPVKSQGYREEHREKPTIPDDWADSTPTIDPAEVKTYIEAVKRSSQSAIHNGALCALEILNLSGIYLPEEAQEVVENSAANIATKYIRDTAEDHNRWLHKQLAELTAELLQLQGEKKALTKKLVRQKKAILDFGRDGDLAKLKAIVYGEE